MHILGIAISTMGIVTLTVSMIIITDVMMLIVVIITIMIIVTITTAWSPKSQNCKLCSPDLRALLAWKP